MRIPVPSREVLCLALECLLRRGALPLRPAAGLAKASLPRASLASGFSPVAPCQRILAKQRTTLCNSSNRSSRPSLCGIPTSHNMMHVPMPSAAQPLRTAEGSCG